MIVSSLKVCPRPMKSRQAKGSHSSPTDPTRRSLSPWMHRVRSNQPQLLSSFSLFSLHLGKKQFSMCISCQYITLVPQCKLAPYNVLKLFALQSINQGALHTIAKGQEAIDFHQSNCKKRKIQQFAWWKFSNLALWPQCEVPLNRKYIQWLSKCFIHLQKLPQPLEEFKICNKIWTCCRKGNTLA